MVTLLLYSPEVIPLEELEKLLAPLDEEDRNRLFELGEAIVNLLTPLTQARSRSELEGLLSGVAGRFFELKQEMFGLLLADEDVGNTLDAWLRAASLHTRQMLEAKADLFGQETKEQFLGVLDSAEGLNQWVVDSVRGGDPQTYALLLMVERIAQPAMLADMAVAALQLMLFDVVPSWIPEAIPVLCSAADDYMCSVEDVFLGASPVEALSSETTDYASVRHKLGL